MLMLLFVIAITPGLRAEQSPNLTIGSLGSVAASARIQLLLISPDSGQVAQLLQLVLLVAATTTSNYYCCCLLTALTNATEMCLVGNPFESSLRVCIVSSLRDP